MLHFWTPRLGTKDGRQYHHYLYKASPEPPFSPLALSSELHLVTHAAYRRVTFAAGLAVTPPVTRGVTRPARVLISYGSGDASGRLLVLNLEEVEQLFLNGPAAAVDKSETA